MNNKNINKPWLEIFENYYSGMSQRELERKYNINIRTIQRVCKNIMIGLVTNPGSVLRQNWVKIESEIMEVLNEG
jgi:Mor family transcriptional regulator